MTVYSQRLISAAKGIAVAGAILWCIPMVAALVTGQGFEEGTRGESLGILVLAMANTIGVVVIFLNEHLAARWLLITGLIFSCFAAISAGRNQWIAAVISGGPFALGAAMLLLAGREAVLNGLTDR